MNEYRPLHHDGLIGSQPAPPADVEKEVKISREEGFPGRLADRARDAVVVLYFWYYRYSASSFSAFGSRPATAWSRRSS